MKNYFEEDNELFDPNFYDEEETPVFGQCYLPPSQDELKRAETELHLKLIPQDREQFFQLILKEQQVRLEPTIQELYKTMNQSGEVEELIHSELFKALGYDDCPLNHALYYAMTRKYMNDPELKPQIFFWRNNVMHGAQIKLNQSPPLIPLLSQANQYTSLQESMQQCHNQQKLCVIFSGSLT